MTNTEAIERFRRIALGLPGAAEGSHAGAADFRVNDRIFVTLAYAARNQGTLKLTLKQQADFLAERSDIFEAVHGGWGRMGMTLIRLDADEDILSGAITTAYRNVVSKAATKRRAAKK
ncbi:Protein of unknown function (DUF419) [Terriglobus roseus DSM 18391]|uniref:YjbR protein n=1 Tax=Terriglobus roseus (strain DSM 18391 / NRRL B-41598 / KBS 63) TaxID=926566 RepID=I3ZI55_TERRK|nr:MmcQ/YjbR family DNA-binding protein [Terriglobus roseus]AFL88923.1 Protein of unknown function (DUF419) [Terriglobus roseus DSM 18391]